MLTVPSAAREEMHLSDAYEHKEEQYELDLTCIVYNINSGYNKDIQKESRVISGYTFFVEKVRSYAQEELTLKEAIECAIDECIREDILAEFFKEHRVEVVKVAALDFTFERRKKLIRRDSLEEGREEGGLVKLISMVCRKLVRGKAPETIAEELEEELDIVEDICKVAEDYAPEYDAKKIYEALQMKII